MKEILRRVRDRPQRVPAGINVAYQSHLGLRSGNPHGKSIFDRDWDNLIILDACRYDKFAEIATLPGKTRKAISLAGATEEFIRTTFAGVQLYDTVYVSANGWYATLADEIDAELHDYQFVESDWWNGYSTHPSTMTDRGLETADQYPRKRLIVHYMQPHKPYLGEIGDRLEYDGDLYDTVVASGATREEINEAYDETLRQTLTEVERLIDGLSGKTVVTADHGELLGDRQSPIPIRWYGHVKSLYVPQLVDVPWHVCPHETRKSRVAEPPSAAHEATPTQSALEQLSGLGYLE